MSTSLQERPLLSQAFFLYLLQSRLAISLQKFTKQLKKVSFVPIFSFSSSLYTIPALLGSPKASSSTLIRSSREANATVSPTTQEANQFIAFPSNTPIATCSFSYNKGRVAACNLSFKIKPRRSFRFLSNFSPYTILQLIPSYSCLPSIFPTTIALFREAIVYSARTTLQQYLSLSYLASTNYSYSTLPQFQAQASQSQRSVKVYILPTSPSQKASIRSLGCFLKAIAQTISYQEGTKGSSRSLLLRLVLRYQKGVP